MKKLSLSILLSLFLTTNAQAAQTQIVQEGDIEKELKSVQPVQEDFDLFLKQNKDNGLNYVEICEAFNKKQQCNNQDAFQSLSDLIKNQIMQDILTYDELNKSDNEKLEIASKIFDPEPFYDFLKNKKHDDPFKKYTYFKRDKIHNDIKNSIENPKFSLSQYMKDQNITQEERTNLFELFEYLSSFKKKLMDQEEKDIKNYALIQKVLDAFKRYEALKAFKRNAKDLKEKSNNN